MKSYDVTLRPVPTDEFHIPPKSQCMPEPESNTSLFYIIVKLYPLQRP